MYELNNSIVISTGTSKYGISNISNISNISCNTSFIDKKKTDNIKNVIYNPPATIVLWKDGTKTVVKVDETEEYNKETGFLMCIAKKYYGNTGYFNKVLDKWCWSKADPEPPEEPNVSIKKPALKYDEETIFENYKVAEAIDNILKDASLNKLSNMYELLNKWVVPEELWEILNPPDYIKNSFVFFSDSVKNRTIEPLMMRVKEEIIQKAVRANKSTLYAINGQTWEDYKREH